MMSYEINQTLIPDAFLALHSPNGNPVLTREDMEARYELCENTALHTSAFFEERSFGASDAGDALQKCHSALVSNATFLAGEAEWIVRRIAELKDWPQPRSFT